MLVAALVSLNTCCANGTANIGNCIAALALRGSAPLVLAGGKATAWLNAPGVGNDGSGYVQMNNSTAPWLPSVVARAAFGLYKSRLIYLREVY